MNISNRFIALVVVVLLTISPILGMMDNTTQQSSVITSVIKMSGVDLASNKICQMVVAPYLDQKPNQLAKDGKTALQSIGSGFGHLAEQSTNQGLFTKSSMPTEIDKALATCLLFDTPLGKNNLSSSMDPISGGIARDKITEVSQASSDQGLFAWEDDSSSFKIVSNYSSILPKLNFNDNNFANSNSKQICASSATDLIKLPEQLCLDQKVFLNNEHWVVTHDELIAQNRMLGGKTRFDGEILRCTYRTIILARPVKTFLGFAITKEYKEFHYAEYYNHNEKKIYGIGQQCSKKTRCTTFPKALLALGGFAAMALLYCVGSK